MGPVAVALYLARRISISSHKHFHNFFILLSGLNSRQGESAIDWRRVLLTAVVVSHFVDQRGEIKAKEAIWTF